MKFNFTYYLANVCFKLYGWKCGKIPDNIGKKYVLIGFPHNSNIDFFTGIMFSWYNKIKFRPIIKKEWYFWPMSIILKHLRFIPIDRSNRGKMVDFLSEEFSNHDDFILAIMPEGTRKKVGKIRTGFWYIAQKAQVPIVMVHKNPKTKEFKVLGSFQTSTLPDDIKKIKELYFQEGYTIPEKY